MRKWILPLALAALLMPGLATSADARPIERERYSFTESFDFDDCGFIIHNEVAGRGVFMLKAPRTQGFPPYLFDSYRIHETLTANGRTLHVDHKGVFKDMRITHVSGTVYRFVAQEAGRPFTVTTEDGTVLFRDRGLLRTTYLIDTRGDNDLDNDVFLEESFELLADRGRHPGFYVDFCDVLTDYFVG